MSQAVIFWLLLIGVSLISIVVENYIHIKNWEGTLIGIGMSLVCIALAVRK